MEETSSHVWWRNSALRTVSRSPGLCLTTIKATANVSDSTAPCTVCCVLYLRNKKQNKTKQQQQKSRWLLSIYLSSSTGSRCHPPVAPPVPLAQTFSACGREELKDTTAEAHKYRTCVMLNRDCIFAWCVLLSFQCQNVMIAMSQFDDATMSFLSCLLFLMHFVGKRRGSGGKNANRPAK